MVRSMLFALALPVLLFAVRTQSFVSDRSDFYDRGKQSGVAVDQKNVLTLSPRLTKIGGITKEYVWRLAADERGTLYAATGHGGTIYVKDPSADTFTEFAKIPEAEVSAITVDASGTVYAAGIPKAVVYRVSKGRVEAIKTPGDIYVWDMIAVNDDVYLAAGGPAGKVYKLTKAGVLSDVLVTKEAHVTSLAYDKRTGDLFAATEGKGIVYRVAKNGAASVLYAPPEEEVHAVIVTSAGTVIAGTASRETDSKSLGDAKTAVGNTEKKARRNSVYAIGTNGVFDRLFSFTDTVILSLSAAEDGTVWIGSGDKGELYRIDTNGIISLALKIDEKQILSLVRTKDGVYCATGNAGAVYRVNVIYGAEGSYTSEALDAGNAARWGSVITRASVPQGTEIIVETRSGNTSLPDGAWSPFTRAANHIESPDARFIQFRVTMRSSDTKRTPEMESIELSYVLKNAAPEVKSVRLVTAAEQQASKDAVKKPLLAPHEAMVSWTAFDANDDVLSYDVFYRRDGERTFKLMKENMRDSAYVFDANKFPSGVYYFKVTASDRPGNDERSALSGVYVSSPMTLDRVPPVIKDFVYVAINGRRRISFRVSDLLSTIKAVRTAVDGGEWQYAEPRDGLYDSAAEEFELSAPLDSDSFSVEASDSDGNVITQAFVLR